MKKVKDKQTYVLLQLNHCEKDVYFVYNIYTDEDDLKNGYNKPYYSYAHQFLIEEHQCDTNIFSSFEDVMVDGKKDPHDLFSYVKSVNLNKYPDICVCIFDLF
jgi:hypothetical protein